MDPDANLQEMLRLAKRIQDRADSSLDGSLERYRKEQTLDAPCLARLVLALDQWLRHGGFLPGPWRAVLPLEMKPWS